eukprot:scaffold67675_cov16-Tisochrysis_lutea.AAC.4
MQDQLPRQQLENLQARQELFLKSTEEKETHRLMAHPFIPEQGICNLYSQSQNFKKVRRPLGLLFEPATTALCYNCVIVAQ